MSIQFKNVTVNNFDENTVQVGGNLVPSAGSTYTLGSAANSWNELNLGPWTIRAVGSGVLDANFGDNGSIIADISVNSFSNNTIVDNDNNIIVGALFDIDGSSRYGFVKYLPSGQLDVSFGDEGYVITDLSNNINISSNFFNGKIVDVDSSNNIIFSGTVGNSDDYNIILARYLSTGAIDLSFGTNGYVFADFSGNDSSIENAVAIDQQNNIVVVGTDTDASGNTRYALSKYLASGAIDLSFGNRGFVVSDFEVNGLSSFSTSVAIDQQNNIVIGGYEGYNSGNFIYYALAKYLPSGVIDLSFGNNGSVVTTFSSTDYSAIFSVAIDQQNNIIVAGTDNVNGGGSYNYAIAKYDAYGDILTGFGNNGVVESDFSGNNYSYGLSVAIDQQNNIILGGFVSIDLYYYALAKYNDNGVLDTTFGTNGIIYTEFANNVSVSFANSVVIDQENNIIVSGFGFNGNFAYALAKYFNSGDLVAQLSGQPNAPAYSLIRK